MRFREKFIRFWYGRNGADQLFQLMMWVSLILSIGNLFAQTWILNVAVLVFLGLATFRLLSKNRYRRQKENAVYLGILSKIKGWFKLCKNRFRDRKTHVYRKCPKCKNVLRLPRIKGAHTVCCPCCSNRFGTKV